MKASTSMVLLLAAAAAAQNPPTGGGEDIRGLHGAITIPAPTSDAPSSVWLVAAAAAVAALGLVLFLRRQRRAAPASAAQMARAALAAAAAARASGDHPRSAALLQAAVRDYLHARFDVPAEARTTSELGRLLAAVDAGRQPLLAACTGRLVHLLHTCEAAAFGFAAIADGEWSEVTATARDLIDRREAAVDERQAAVAAPTQPAPAMETSR